MDRRSFFRTAGGGVVAICSICASLARAPAEGAHWTYSGAQGPDHWGELAPEAQVCAAGNEQSPIDLTGAVPADLPKIEVSYKPQPLRVINNGHTIQVNFQPGSEIAIGKDHYTLLQYHFHHPSEHLLAGNPFAMELHLVHRHASGQLAVLGAFIKPGKANPIIEAVWKAAPKEEGPEQLVGVNWDTCDPLIKRQRLPPVFPPFLPTPKPLYRRRNAPELEAFERRSYAAGATPKIAPAGRSAGACCRPRRRPLG